MSDPRKRTMKEYVNIETIFMFISGWAVLS
jgi:hypothetical protein